MLRRAARIVSLSTLATVVAAGPISGCGERSSSPPSASAVASALPAVPEPENVGATLYIPDGGATWERLRAALGGEHSLLPSRFGSFVVSAVGLPISCADLVSDHEPVVGLVLDPSLLHPFEGAIAIHLRSADSVLSRATQGELATHRSERKTDSKGDFLTRIGSGPDVALAVFGNHLVIGTSASALSTLGPYLAQRVSGLATSGGDATLDVRADFLKLALPVARMRASLPGSAGGSVLNPAIGELFQRIDGATHLRLSLELAGLTGPASAKLGLVIDRPPEAEAAKIAATTAPVSSLLGLPASIDLGIVDAHPTAAPNASPFGPLVTWLDPSDQTDVERAGAALAAARTPLSLIGYENGPIGGGVYARATWSDAKAGRAALDELVAIANRKTAKAALALHDVQMVAKRTVLENVGSVVRFRLSDAPTDPKKPRSGTVAAPTVDVVFRDGDTSLDIATSLDAQTALVTLATAPRLETDPAVVALVGLAPPAVHAGVFLDVARLARGARGARSRTLVVEVDEPAKVTLTGWLDGEALRFILGALTE